jgi:hypothetical protein
VTSATPEWTVTVRLAAGDGRGQVDEFDRWRDELVLDPEAQERLLRKLVRSHAKRNSFPPGEGHEEWTRAAVDDFILDLFDKKKDPRILLRLLERATSKEHFERSILITVHRHLIDQAKATESGKLRRRLVTVLGQDQRFVFIGEPPPDHWALAGCPTDLWQGDVRDLLDVAYKVTGVIVDTWNEAGQTAAHVRHALQTVSAAVIDWAGRAVRAQDLAELLRERFELLAPLRVSSAALLPVDDEPATALLERPEDSVVVMETVDRVWATLTEDERTVLPYMHKPVRGWSKAVGLRPKVAELVVERVKEKVRLAVPLDEHTATTITLLRERSQGRA